MKFIFLTKDVIERKVSRSLPEGVVFFYYSKLQIFAKI